jgi:hypothetical protein
MTLAETYLEGLHKALNAEGNAALSHATGATKAQLDALRAAYPLCPTSLFELLGHINGTYHQNYGDMRIGVLMLGSDVGTYPYYLLSTDQILEEATAKFSGESIAEIYGDDVNKDDELVDPRIDALLPMNRRLCFSHCMNNGGTSQLYVDFNPTVTGRVGQIVRFLHDPDSYAVIADDFDHYLKLLIDNGYAFLADQDELHWQTQSDQDD